MTPTLDLKPCACRFDMNKPDSEPPVIECNYHQLRSRDAATALQQAEQALKAAEHELFATYGDQPRLEPLFEQIEAALTALRSSPAPPQEQP